MADNIKINLEDLIIAFEDHSCNFFYYLDLESGEVIFIPGDGSELI